MWMIVPLILLITPIAALVAFGISLSRYIRRDKDNEKQCSERKFYLIMTSIPAAFMLLAVIVLGIMICTGFSFM